MNSVIYETSEGYRTHVGIQDGTEYGGPFPTLTEAQDDCWKTEKIMNGNDIDVDAIPIMRGSLGDKGPDRIPGELSDAKREGSNPLTRFMRPI
tara:strand:+ start:34744 stop:35022 length:279 start_codon:yes stop_codon:yes gene_type:complete